MERKRREDKGKRKEERGVRGGRDQRDNRGVAAGLYSRKSDLPWWWTRVTKAPLPLADEPGLGETLDKVGPPAPDGGMSDGPVPAAAPDNTEPLIYGGGLGREPEPEDAPDDIEPPARAVGKREGPEPVNTPDNNTPDNIKPLIRGGGVSGRPRPAAAPDNAESLIYGGGLGREPEPVDASDDGLDVTPWWESGSVPEEVVARRAGGGRRRVEAAPDAPRAQDEIGYVYRGVRYGGPAPAPRPDLPAEELEEEPVAGSFWWEGGTRPVEAAEEEPDAGSPVLEPVPDVPSAREGRRSRELPSEPEEEPGPQLRRIPREGTEAVEAVPEPVPVPNVPEQPDDDDDDVVDLTAVDVTQPHVGDNVVGDDDDDDVVDLTAVFDAATDAPRADETAGLGEAVPEPVSDMPEEPDDDDDDVVDWSAADLSVPEDQPAEEEEQSGMDDMDDDAGDSRGVPLERREEEQPRMKLVEDPPGGWAEPGPEPLVSPPGPLDPPSQLAATGALPEGSPGEQVSALAAQVCPGGLLLVDTAEAPLPEWAGAAVAEARDDLDWRAAEGEPVGADEYLSLAIVAHVMGQHEEADGYLKKALPLSVRFGPILNALAVISLARGKIARAVVYCKDAVHETGGDDSVRAAVSSNLGDLFRLQGEAEQAAEAYETAIQCLEPQGEPGRLSQLHLRLGGLCQRLGDTDRGLQHLGDAVRLSREAGDAAGQVRSLVELGSALTESGRFEDALDNLEDAVRICMRTGDRAGAALVEDGMGAVCMAQEQWSRALKYFEDALSLHRELGRRESEAATLSNMEKVHEARGDADEARRCREEAQEVNRELGRDIDPPLERGEGDDAQARLLKAEELLRRAESAE